MPFNFPARKYRTGDYWLVQHGQQGRTEPATGFRCTASNISQFRGAELDVKSIRWEFFAGYATQQEKIKTRFPLGQSSRGLARVARVPIHLARHVHYDCQHDEERNCAHEQRVILLPQSDVEKCVNARESCADH
jgi:hypothetical protein